MIDIVASAQCNEVELRHRCRGTRTCLHPIRLRSKALEGDFGAPSVAGILRARIAMERHEGRGQWLGVWTYASTLRLLFVSIPLDRSKQQPRSWFLATLAVGNDTRVCQVRTTDRVDRGIGVMLHLGNRPMGKTRKLMKPSPEADDGRVGGWMGTDEGRERT